MNLLNKPIDIPDISFEKRAQILSCDLLKSCLFVMEHGDSRHHFTKKLYSKFIGTSQVLEDFLDFHGAKNNKNWYFYRELVAAVRHLSLSCYCQKHITNRLIFYDLPDLEKFAKGGNSAMDFLNRALINLAPVIIEEAKRLHIAMPGEAFSPADFPAISTSESLDYDIDDENRDAQQKHIVKIANEFLNIAEDFELLEFYKLYTIEEILEFVPERINEVTIRRFEMLVHNLQSSFDTYVIHGGFRFGNRKLKQLRSFFSVAFHLMQMIGRLLHFYERHLHEAGYKNVYNETQKRLSTLVSPEILLDYTINYGLYYVCHYLTKGKDIASEILNQNIERSSIQVGIPQKLGFHLRPSLLVAKVVQYYGGKVTLHVGSDSFDASSVLDMQWAGGKISKENTSEVVFKGDSRALKDIEILAGVNYGEDTMGKDVPLPTELNYLR